MEERIKQAKRIIEEFIKLQVISPAETVIITDEEKLDIILDLLGARIPKAFSWIKSLYMFKPQKISSISKEVPIMPVFRRPVEFCYIPNKRTYRIVPKFPMLAVDENAHVVEIIDNEGKPIPKFRVVRPHFTYNYCRINFNINSMFKEFKLKKLTLHRLVASAWSPNDDYVNKNVVDHIDANRFNNNANNLRWVSPSLNAARASNKKLEDARWLVKEIGSDEVYQFASLKDVANFLGKDKRGFSSKKCPMIIKTINGGYILEDKLNFKNWELEDYYNERGEPYRYIVDDEKFVKLIDVIRRYNLPLNMRHYRKNVIKNLESMGHVVKVLAPERLYMKQKHVQCIIVEDIVDGTIQKFETKKEVMEAIGIPIAPLNVRLRKERLGQIYKDRWLIYWCGYRPRPRNVTKRNQPIKAFNIETKEERLYLSLRRAAASLGIDRRSLKRALENNKVLKNWKFEYIE